MIDNNEHQNELEKRRKKEMKIKQKRTKLFLVLSSQFFCFAECATQRICVKSKPPT